jgi:hypothetical protein
LVGLGAAFLINIPDSKPFGLLLTCFRIELYILLLLEDGWALDIDVRSFLFDDA